MYRFLKDVQGSHFIEHHKYPNGEDISSLEENIPPYVLFLGIEGCKCFEVRKFNDKSFLHTSYYIGVDWLVENSLAIHIQPKLNANNLQIDYLKMLFHALKHPGVIENTQNLYDIKFGNAEIEIERRQDLLTPLLTIHFLSLLREIVKKGLKKSYYTIDKNLKNKVKGKILVGQTIKTNVLKNKPLSIVCRYEEFGFNSLENRLLKKALLFIQNFLPSFRILGVQEYITNTFNFILPAFENVSAEVNLNELKHSKTNVFYKEYSSAIHLAKLILKRRGYNISSVNENEKIKTPPFWIDMSKLFELYVLGMLTDRYNENILYGKVNAGGKYGLPDYLLKIPKGEMVIDAKYKPIYQGEKYDIDNIRQLSGYARDKGVLSKLNLPNDKVVDCLIIYPDQNVSTKNLLDVDLRSDEISQFTNFFKVGINLPVIENNS